MVALELAHPAPEEPLCFFAWSGADVPKVGFRQEAATNAHSQPPMPPPILLVNMYSLCFDAGEENEEAAAKLAPKWR